MRILELSLRNYRVFEELDLELPARVIGIFGANGSGKTTLLESMQYALYGRARTDKAQIRTSGVLTECAVRVVFEHGGQQYEVRRTIRGKNHQTDAELFVGGMRLAAGVSDVDAEIERLLHMELPVFRASVFAEQKQLDAFSEVTSGKRKEMVLRLLGIRPVEEARTVARKEAREAKERAEELAARLPDQDELRNRFEQGAAYAEAARAQAEQAAVAFEEARARARAAEEAFERSDEVRERVERLQIELREAEKVAAAAERRGETLRERLDALEAAVKELPALEEELQRIVDAPKRLTAAQRLAEVEAELRQVEERTSALEDVDAEAMLAALEVAEAERQAAREAAALARSDLHRARASLVEANEALARASEADPSQPCPTCGRPLGDDFEEYLRHCRAAVADAESAVKVAERVEREGAAAVKRADADALAARKQGERAQRALADRATLAERGETLASRFDELVAAFDGVLPDLAGLEAEAARAEELARHLAKLQSDAERLDETRTDLDRCELEVRTARERGEELGRELATLAFDAEEHQRVEKERREARRLLEDARGNERLASDALKDAEARVREVEAALEQVREIGARVRELRDEARVMDRVSALLEGFRTFLYGRIMPQLSRDAEALFRDLTNHEYEDLRIDEDTLAIEIADADRYYPIERFSGSEVDLANLALRVAISTHLSRMAGADVGLMVLDEVMAALDAERKDLFVRTIGKLSQRFHQLFVITHAEQVKDQFPASIEVRRIGRRRSAARLV